MSHEQLWAPWRIGYIAGDKAAKSVDESRFDWLAGADRGCFMCRAVAAGRVKGLLESSPEDERLSADRENLVVRRQACSFAILNRYPYNNGHLLVAPLRHVGLIGELTDGEHLELQQQIVGLTNVLSRIMNAEGFNVGLNLGRVAGAGVPGHLHWHIVPRWSGDTNFISSIDSVRIIPQALDTLWEMLTDALAGVKAS